MFRRAWVCVVGCIALAHGTASAGLGEDADRLCELWSRHYTVTRLKPRLSGHSSDQARSTLDGTFLPST